MKGASQLLTQKHRPPRASARRFTLLLPLRVWNTAGIAAVLVKLDQVMYRGLNLPHGVASVADVFSPRTKLARYTHARVYWLHLASDKGIAQ